MYIWWGLMLTMWSVSVEWTLCVLMTMLVEGPFCVYWNGNYYARTL
jgi:hypothetical protein